MNKTINKFLLAGYKFMPQVPLRQTEFTYSACGLFTKTKDLKKRDILDKFIKTIVKHVFNMIWLMEILKH